MSRFFPVGGLALTPYSLRDMACRDAVIVRTRNAPHEVATLSMRCDRKEFPEPTGDAAVIGNWITMIRFRGAAVYEDLNESHSENVDEEGQVLALDGALSIAVTDRRAVGIAVPLDDSTPAIWFSLPLEGISVGTDGQKGWFAKRPAVIRLAGNGWFANLTEVGRLLNSLLQMNQESSLLTALTNRAPTTTSGPIR